MPGAASGTTAPAAFTPKGKPKPVAIYLRPYPEQLTKLCPTAVTVELADPKPSQVSILSESRSTFIPPTVSTVLPAPEFGTPTPTIAGFNITLAGIGIGEDGMKPFPSAATWPVFSELMLVKSATGLPPTLTNALNLSVMLPTY